eukprot:TRINITY_DN914_c0_g1_i18.p1 TRINITY_DN914_c0_g1~~TRINITY_DN914_c0_g1_i18.p1  ORF type:complete len:544 (+),score=119.34 TRINITY_DN914_c0_g1_i18:68-1633(+)
MCIRDRSQPARNGSTDPEVTQNHNEINPTETSVGHIHPEPEDGASSLKNPVAEESAAKAKKKKKSKKHKKSRSSSSSSSSSVEASEKKNKKKHKKKSSRSRSRTKERKSKRSRSATKNKKRRSPSPSGSSSSSGSSSRSPSRSRSRRRSPRHRRRGGRDNRNRDRSRDRHRPHHHHANNRRDRDRDRQHRDRKPSPHATDRDGKRSRTRSPPPFLRRGRSPNGVNRVPPPNPVVSDIMEQNKPKLFWDGFQWVPKTNSAPHVDPAILNQTRKMRRIQITNLPLYLGLVEKDVMEIVKKFLFDNYLNDFGNLNPVLTCQVNTQTNSAILEISSVEETNRLVKIETLKIFGHSCKISRLGESQFGNTQSLANLVSNAQTAAQAQAAALTALKVFQNKDGGSNQSSNFVLTKPGAQIPPSKVLKISNGVDQERSLTMPETEYEEIFDDLLLEFSKYGKVIDGFIVKPQFAAIAAEAGCVFLEYEQLENAETALNEMFGRKFDNRDLKIIFMNEEVYYKHFRGLR